MTDTDAAYNELLNGLYDAVLISDLEGHVVDGNRRAREFLRFTNTELLRQNVTAIVSGLKPQVLEKIRGHLAAGRFTLLDARCIRKDGVTFPAEIAIGRINLGAQGNLVFSIRNIGARKETQQRLRTEHNALQNSASAIAIADTDAVIRYTNPAFLKLFGLEKHADAHGQRMGEVVRIADGQEDIVARARNAETWIGEIQVNVGPRKLWLQAAAAPNRDMSDAIIGMVFSFIDVTERRKAEDALRREAEAQMAQARRQRDFSGSLNIVPVTDVLQVLESTGRSGTLTILDDEGAQRARAAFLDGQLVFATLGALTGEDAVHAFLSCETGAFDFHEGIPIERDHRMTKPVMSMLLEGARLTDETGG